MAGLLADLSVAGRLLLRATGRRLRGELEPEPDRQAFSDELEPILASAPEGLIRQASWLDLPANQAPWVATGIDLSAGDSVSVFSVGRVMVNGALDLHFDPALQLWFRVGEAGTVFRGTRHSHSFTASDPGSLHIGNYFPSAWKNQQGELATEDSVYKSNSGEFLILVVVWQGSAIDGIRGLPGADASPLLSNELARLELGDTAPEGWQYLWHVGPAEIFRDGHEPEQGQPCIHCRTHRDVGILQRDVDLPLTPETEISWRWCVSQLPSTLREDTLPSHDYLSIAVEFDDGRDITYYWSATLPEGYGYDCPLPNWSGIEYHVVLRSGKEKLGQWLDERRNLYEDYRHYMGDPPARITRVWFIAVSIFQREEGACDYADIRLHGPGGETRLL